MRLVVFDLGGTTIRDRGDVPAAFRAALESESIVYDSGEIDSWRGASKREVLAHLVARQQLPSAATDRAYQTFRNNLMTRFRAAGDLAFPASASAFMTLRAAGVAVALNSGFDRDIVGLVLDASRWETDWFAAVVCAEDVPEGRPEPHMIFRAMEAAGVSSAGAVAVVGDTSLDLEAGARAGAGWRIGVLSGAHDRKTLERGPWTHIVRDVSYVPGILEVSAVGVPPTMSGPGT